MSELKYPIGMQIFSKIRENDCVYVDKTAYIEKLVALPNYIFLSRPRRFGKSLLLSTIEAYFQGRRDLFDGLVIADSDYDWRPWPVLHLDFTGADYNSPTALKSKCNNMFKQWEEKYNIAPDPLDTLGVRFGNIIQGAHKTTGKQVVILIDEYDKPLLETVDNPKQQEQFRNELRGIYGNLKGQDAHIRFAMLTGVTRLGHLSIFSDLNNLEDISMDESYAGICGITESELRRYFHSGVEAFAKNKGKTSDDIYEALKRNYDGYHFSPEASPDIYNPFSLLNALKKQNINDYWFRTGTPTFLTKMLRSSRIRLQKFSDLESDIRSLSDVSFDLSNYVSVLYQSGYLTIKGYDREFGTVSLGFPNMEVERGFFDALLHTYSPNAEDETTFSIRRFVLDVREGRPEAFMQRLQSFFADFGYDSFDIKDLEQHYQDVMFILVRLMGFYTTIEYKTASGRIDMVVGTPDYIYVFEFKLDKSPREAIEQIDAKGYLLPFKADGRQLVKIGANFSSYKRTITAWIIEFE